MTQRGRADYLALGDWNAVCGQCGRKRKASTMIRNWQGLYMCPEHNESRQPQDFARGVPDNQTPPWSQPMPEDVFVQTDFIVTESSDLLFGPLINIIAETGYEPLETET